MDSSFPLEPLPVIPDTAVPTQASDQPKPFNFEDLKSTAEDALKDARVKWEDLLKDGAEYVKANPGKSMVAAVGVGFVLGLIFND